jgi:hypothetical protein
MEIPMHSHKCVFFAITNTVWGIGKQAQVEKKHEMDLNIHTLWIYIHGSTIQKKNVWFVGIPHEPWQLQPNWGTLKTPPIKKKR